MHVKQKLRAILSGSIRSTKSIGEITLETIQSVLHLKISGSTSSSFSTNSARKKLKSCKGNFQNSSRLQLLFNEFGNEEEKETDGMENREDSPSTSASSSMSGSRNRRNTSSEITSIHCPLHVPDSPILFEKLKVDVAFTATAGDIETENKDEDCLFIPASLNSKFEYYSSSSAFISTTPVTNPVKRMDESEEPFDFRKLSSRNVNLKHKGENEQTSQCQQIQKSIQVISVEQLHPTKLVVSAKSKPRRLSIRGLKKSGKGARKILTRGFKAMGNSMIYATIATHGMPVPYDCPASYIKATTKKGEYGAAEWNNYQDYEYEEDRRKYIAFWSLAFEKQEKERQKEKELQLQQQQEESGNYNSRSQYQQGPYTYS